MYIIVAIIAFGVLITVHELGHFTAAKALGVRVNEFAIGMGPKLLKKQGKETLYSLRALPLGGFCALEGENGDSADARSFGMQKRWRRIVILASGSVSNILLGFIIVIILVSGMKSFTGTTITKLEDGFPNKGVDGLMAGDTVISINGERLYYIDDFRLFMQIYDNGKVDLVIRRDGESIKLNEFPMERREYTVDGKTELRFGITMNRIEGNAWEKLKFSCYSAYNYIRLVRVSLAQLISGTVGVRDLSGPVGIIDAMNDVGRSSSTALEALASIANFTAIIAINIAVMNLLPIPALDGGRIVFIIITWIIEKVIRRRVDPKYEGYIHTATMALLMGLMVFILINDVVKIVSG